MKLGVLGGTFDPFHAGHVEMALGVRRALGLDAVHLVPCRLPPHKERPRLTPGADRLAMIALAVQDHPALVPDSRELLRPAPSFTIDTLKGLAADRPEARLFFIMGMDSFREIHLWKEHRALVEGFDLVVVNRPGSTRPRENEVPEVARGRLVEAGQAPDTGAGKVHILEIPPQDVSSTAIRRLARKGAPLKGLVPTAVESYIHRCNLYCQGDDSG
jgi:nicotinate-nucleotide adenylyltransferase